MRIITVDNGNTNPHVGIYRNDKLESVVPLKEFTPKQNDFVLISDVGRPLSFKPSIDLKKFRYTKDDIYYFFEMPVLYSETLGDDRLICAYALFSRLDINETILFIDAGTFITIDIVNQEGFNGGYIFPGLNTFLSSYQKGSNLKIPELTKNFKISGLPQTTEDAILGATDFYLESILENIIKKYSPNKIIITGGSLEFIYNKIQKLNLSKVQLETCPHLIHSSLYLIFENHFRSTIP